MHFYMVTLQVKHPVHLVLSNLVEVIEGAFLL